jgi:hypothetical protein
MTNIKPTLAYVIYFQVFPKLPRFCLFVSWSSVVMLKCFLVKYYPNKWIGRGGLKPWPSRFPCLTHSDFSVMLLREGYHLCVYDARHDWDAGDYDYTCNAALVESVLSGIWTELGYRWNTCSTTKTTRSIHRTLLENFRIYSIIWSMFHYISAFSKLRVVKYIYNYQFWIFIITNFEYIVKHIAELVD